MLIALLIVSMALPILISSFVFTYSEQEKFLDEVILDRLANTVFVSLFEDLLANRISYKDLEAERETALSEAQMGLGSKNFEGTFSFKKLKPEKPDKSSNYFVELWRANLNFKRKKSEKVRPFSFDFLVIRDLTAQNAPKESNAEEEKEKK